MYIISGKAGSKESLGIIRRMWVDNIKMDLGEIGWDGVDWTSLAQDRDKFSAPVKEAINFQVP
jgi:hypothetical protein